MGGDQSSLKSKNSYVVDANGRIVPNAHTDDQTDGGPRSRNQSLGLHSTPINESDANNGNERCDIKHTDSNGNKSGNAHDDSDVMNQSTLVVVNSVETDEPSIESDPLFIRINQIPSFNAILDPENNKKFSWFKSNPGQPLSKLNSTSGTRIGQLYNGYLKKHTQLIANDQTRLTKRIKTINVGVNSMMKEFTTRQRQHAQHAHKFGQIPEISRTLFKCQNTLQDALKTAEILNDMLPPDDKLEPFVWCAEEDTDTSCSLNVHVKEEKPMSVTRILS